VTDDNWYRFLADRPGVTEVNFWQPSGAREFRVLAPGEPFFFKTHYPHNKVVGGGFFSDSARLKVRQPLAGVALPGEPLSDEIAAIVRDELNVKSLTFGAPEVKLDTEITEDLRLEGLAREIVRAIQDRRKKLGLNVEDRIDTRYDADGMLARALERHADYIKAETLSVRLAPGREDGFDGEQMMLEGEQIWIGLKRN